MSSFIYQKGLHKLGAGGAFDIEAACLADEIYLLLLDSTYPADDASRANHSNYSDIVAGGWEIATGGGYTRGDATNPGGKLYTNGTVEVHRNDPEFQDRVEMQSPVIWSASTISAAYAATYHWTGDATTSAMLFLWDFGGVRVTNSRDFTVAWLDTFAWTLGPCA